MEKVISLIIPCFNVESFIDRCMRSVVNQTIGMERLEIILVDDASTDSTWDKLLKWEHTYPDSIILVQHEVNKKQGAARNTGLCYVTAPYVCFLDADDWLDLTMLEKLYDKLSELNVDAVGCDYSRTTNQVVAKEESNEKGILYHYDTEDERKKLIKNGCPGYVCGKLIRSSDIQKYQLFFPENCYYEDIDWKDQFCLHLKSYYQLEEKLYFYYVNADSTTMQEHCKRHFDRFSIEMNRLERYKKLSLFQAYHKELEFHFIKSFYLNTLYIFLSRCIDFTPQILNFMQMTLRTTFPKYKDNPYIESELSKLEQYLLRTVDMGLSQSEIDQLANSLRKDIGVN